MSVSYGFYNSLNHDRRYNANEMASIFDGIVYDGVYKRIGDHFLVTQHGDTPDMTVNVGSGRAWFNHTWTYNSATLPLELDPSSMVLDRIDAVVLEVNADVNTRENTIKIIKGTPSSNPVRPEMIDNADVHQHALAYIYVTAATEAITDANITNVVGTGLETPFATSSVDDIPDMKAATQSSNGDHGLVPTPGAGKQNSFLRGDGIWYDLVNAIYPVGSIYMTTVNTNPATRFPGTTWVAWGSGQVPVGVNAADGDFNTAERTGGAKSHSYTPAGSVSQPAFYGATASLGHSGGAVGGHTLTIYETAAHKHAFDNGDLGNEFVYLCSGHNGFGFASGLSGSDGDNRYKYLFSIRSDGKYPFWHSSTTDATGSNAAHDHPFTQPTAHSYTPAGTVSQPAFTGTAADQSHLQPYITCYMWKRTA